MLAMSLPLILLMTLREVKKFLTLIRYILSTFLYIISAFCVLYKKVLLICGSLNVSKYFDFAPINRESLYFLFVNLHWLYYCLANTYGRSYAWLRS